MTAVMIVLYTIATQKMIVIVIAIAKMIVIAIVIATVIVIVSVGGLNRETKGSGRQNSQGSILGEN